MRVQVQVKAVQGQARDVTGEPSMALSLRISLGAVLVDLGPAMSHFRHWKKTVYLLPRSPAIISRLYSVSKRKRS